MARVLLLFIGFATTAVMNDHGRVMAQLEGGPSAAEAGAGPAEGSATTDTEPHSLNSAQQAFETFIQAIEDEDYRSATSVLDFSSFDSPPDPYVKLRHARRLWACIDRIPLIDASKLSDQPDGSPVSLPPGNPDSEIVLARGEDGQWRFSPETVMRIDALYQIIDSQPSTNASEIASAQPEVDASKAETPPDNDEAGDIQPKQAAEIPAELSSARRTMRTLFDSLDKRDYAAAVATLDFSQIEQNTKLPNAYRRIGYARHLQEILARMAVIDYQKISDDPLGPTFRFPPGQVNQPIQITRDQQGLWRFSSDTVKRVDSLYELYKDKPLVNLPEESKRWYERQLVLDNETWRILTLFAAIFLSILVGQSLKGLLRWRANSLEQSGHSQRATVLRTIAAAAVGLAFLVGLRAGTSALVLDHQVGRLIWTVIHVTFVVVIGFICFRLVDVAVALLHGRAERSGSAMNKMLAPIVSTSMRVTIIILVLLEIATAISDQPPSAVIAGLGAGGLAIGLAAQETFKNLFGSVMIFADRPFEIGDRILIDGHDGPVEKVGFRSTRIRTLEGHFVTVPNAEMANKTVQNIGRRPYIRRIMNLRVASDTTPVKIREALQILRDLVANHDGMQQDHPPRVFFEDFLDTALNIRVIYWFYPPEYWDYCDYGERLNLQIVEAFDAAGIRFAVPSHRILLDSDSDDATYDR